MPEPVDMRESMVQLRKRLVLDRTNQDFLSLESFLVRSAKKTEPDEQVLLTPGPDQRMLLDGVARALNGLYVHMAFKRARYGANPIEGLQALARSVPMPEADFNRALLSIFRELHDPHTTYQLPAPYRWATAFLPFMIRVTYVEQGSEGWDPEPRFLVTHVAKGFVAAGFGPGALVTHWNGLPIEMMVHQLALGENGANAHACFARAMFNLTVRPLSRLMPPDAPNALMRFYPPGEKTAAQEILVDWSVRYTEESDNLRALLFDLPAPGDQGWKFWDGIDEDVAYYRILSLRHPTAAGKVEVGVIRICSFDEEPNSFVNTFTLLVDEMRRVAPMALILDVRGNGGGTVQCGERLLQLFSPGAITPASFQFLNTPLVQQLVRRHEAENLARFGLETDTGALFARAGQITTEEEANHIGQRYYGRVALITDAHCYSTTDIFAAGFQDHRIGPVIGTDGSTGGGGANVWKYNTKVAGWTPDDGRAFPSLPNSANLGISVRQCLRTGRFHGEILEDFGVTPDFRCFMTEQDLLHDYGNLYEFAFSKLLWGSGLQEISLDLKVRPFDFSPNETDQFIEINCQTAGLVQCDVMVNSRNADVFQARAEGFRWQDHKFADGSVQSFEQVELRGYSLLPQADFPFYTPEEVMAMGEAGKKKTFQMVASRKVSRESEDWGRGQEMPDLPVPASERRGILYFVQGGNRSAAMEALAIAGELNQLNPKVTVRFASYGMAARTLAEHGQQVIDLRLPDRPEAFAVEKSFPRVWEQLMESVPALIVAHEEFEIGRLAGFTSQKDLRRGPELRVPCVLVTADLEGGGWNREICASLRETILLGKWPREGDPELSRLRISEVGPIVRPLRYWHEDMANEKIPLAVKLAKQKAREKARQEAGWGQDELVVAIFIAHGSRTELSAPVYELLTAAFGKIDPTTLRRRIWDAQGGKADVPFQGKRLVFDPAGRTKKGPFFEPADFDRVMAAADVAMTKGDRSIAMELAAMGVPTLTISHSGQETSGLGFWRGRGNLTKHYAGLDADELKGAMVELLDRAVEDEVNPKSLPPVYRNGARNAAQRLHELLLDMEEFGPRIIDKAHRLAAKQMKVSEFRTWFDDHCRWTQEPRELIGAMMSFWLSFDHRGMQAARSMELREVLEDVECAALEEAIRPFSAHE